MKKKLLFVISLLVLFGCVDNPKKTEPKKEKVVKHKKIKQGDNKEESELKKDFEKYLGYLDNLDTEGVISMTYPKLFIPINKTVFKQYINTLLTSPEISVQSFDTNITKIGKIESFSNGKFAKVKYKATIKLAFVNPNLYNDDLSIRVLRNVLQKKYGKENIQLDSNSRIITIHEEKKMIAIKENNDNEWKFIGDNSEYRKLYPDVLPVDILNKI
jgi:hypothetical protein